MTADVTANGRVRISVTANYQDGDFLYREREFMAETAVHALQKGEFAVLEVRLVLPRRDAEELMRSMMSGKTELLIDSISPSLDAG